MARLSIIEGIGGTIESKFKASGIASLEALLEAGSTSGGRKELAEKCGLSEKQILKWVNHADLIRIKGVGGEYAELLEAAGVDTVPELATRKPENLFAKMVEVNAEKKLVRKLPVERQVAGWVSQAKELPRKLTY